MHALNENAHAASGFLPGATAIAAPDVGQEDFCQMDIFADEDLSFHVRVSCCGRRFVAGGFRNPDDAQRHGVHALLAMTGLAGDLDI